jgi:hypothetical protein
MSTLALNKLIAIESGVKSAAKRKETDLYHVLQKNALLNGINRTYQPKDDDGDRLPSETTLVQVKVEKVIKDLSAELTRLFDVTLTKEVGNSQAKADVVVDGKTLLKQVPVTYLLFLEKQLVDINTFIGKLPVLDPASEWVYDSNNDVHVTTAVQTVKTKKVPRNWVKAEATDKHPAQVEIFHEDVIVGTWTKVDYSGAIPATRKAELLARVEKLITAVKFAREEANSLIVDDQHAGDKVFSYLFS